MAHLRFPKQDMKLKCIAVDQCQNQGMVCVFSESFVNVEIFAVFSI